MSNKARRSSRQAGRRGKGDPAPQIRAAAPPAGTPRRKGGRSDILAYIDRYPDLGPAAIAVTLASVLLGNAWLWWLSWRGALTPSGIVLLIFVEAVLLSLISSAQRASVPLKHRMKKERVKASKMLISWIAAVVGIGGAYVMWAVVLGETDTAIRLLTSPDAWMQYGLHIALGITLLFTVIGLLADHRHYLRAGPPLVSSVDMEATARRVTLIYGALVFAIPMIGLLALAFWVLMRLTSKLEGNLHAAVFGLGLLGAFIGAFFLPARLVDDGPHGWAAVYLLGKAIVEGLFAMMPVLARKTRREKRGGAADAQPGK